MSPSREDFALELERTFQRALQDGLCSVDVRAGDLHERLGGYPGRRHRMTLCCDVMARGMFVRDEIVATPPSGKGAGLVVRYRLPREQPPCATATQARRIVPAASASSLRRRTRTVDTGASQAAAWSSDVRASQAHGLATSRPIVLVSCVKKKLAVPAEARHLYTSPLFRGMRAYAEATSASWFILSAEHGVLQPWQVVAPYERTLNRMGSAARNLWAARVREQLAACVPAGAAVTILAGARYRDTVEPYLRSRGHRVVVPMAGLTLGQQLRWLRDAKAGSDAR